MSSTTFDEPLPIRDQIAGFSAARCRLYHEVARYDPSLPFPIIPPASDTPHFKPIFCPIEQRSVRIGCAHTMSRSVMRRAIQQLGEDVTLLEELSGIEVKICRLDHAMSETAKEAARIRETIEEMRARGSETDPELESTLEALRLRMREIAAEHDGSIGEMDRFRWKLVARLDAADVAAGDGSSHDDTSDDTAPAAGR